MCWNIERDDLREVNADVIGVINVRKGSTKNYEFLVSSPTGQNKDFINYVNKI